MNQWLNNRDACSYFVRSVGIIAFFFLLSYPAHSFANCFPNGGGLACTTRAEANDGCSAYLSSQHFVDGCSTRCVDFPMANDTGGAVNAIQYQNGQGTCCWNPQQSSCSFGGWGYAGKCVPNSNDGIKNCCPGDTDPCCGKRIDDPCCHDPCMWPGCKCCDKANK